MEETRKRLGWFNMEHERLGRFNKELCLGLSASADLSEPALQMCFAPPAAAWLERPTAGFRNTLMTVSNRSTFDGTMYTSAEIDLPISGDRYIGFAT